MAQNDFDPEVKRKWLSKLSVFGIVAGQLFLAAATGLAQRPAPPNLTFKIVMVVLMFLGGICIIGPIAALAELQKRHPKEEHKKSPLDSSQFALSPTEFVMRVKNEDDKAKFIVCVVSMILFLFLLLGSGRWFRAAARPQAAQMVYIFFFVTLLLMAFASWRSLGRAPFTLEAKADAQGVATRYKNKPLAQCQWNQIASAALEERFNKLGQRERKDFVLRGTNDEILVSLPVERFKADDAHAFQSVVARYLKPTNAP